MNKRYVAGTCLVTSQLQRSVANTLAGNWLIGQPPEFVGQYVPLIRKVTPEQVGAIGKTMWRRRTSRSWWWATRRRWASSLKRLGRLW
jgi:hypothetical protein